MTTPGTPEAVRALDPSDAVLLADVGDGRVHRDPGGQDWLEGDPVRKTSVQALLQQDLVEPVEPPAAGEPPHGLWKPTALGRAILDEITAMLAVWGRTLDDMRASLEQLYRDGVL